jgi:bacterioferritin
MDRFTVDIKEIQRRARENLDQGPITDAYAADRQRVVDVLNEALATELVCVLRYRSHYFRASGLAAKSVADEFLQHAAEEQDHAERIAARIVQLQGEPNFDPVGLAERSHSQYVGGEGLVDMLKEDLVAERIAIDIYSEIIRWIGDSDPTTRVLIQDILRVEEEHADDLRSLLGAQPPSGNNLDGARVDANASSQ